MDDKEFVKEVMRKDRLSIARVPTRTKELFAQYAKDYYCDDYGLCLKSILEDALEYRVIKRILSDKISIEVKSNEH